MLSLAAFTEGHYAQAFPSFGSERTGAPVVAFARVNNQPIRLREPVMEPNAVLIQDRTLLESVPVFAGLTKDGYVLLNSSKTVEELGLEDLLTKLPAGHVITIPATKFAMERIGKPLPGAAMLAGFAALTGRLKLESIQQAFMSRYKGKVGQANSDVAADAYNFVINAKNSL